MVEPNLNISPRHFLSFDVDPLEAMKQFQFFIIHKLPPENCCVSLKQHQQIFFMEC